MSACLAASEFLNGKVSGTGISLGGGGKVLWNRICIALYMRLTKLSIFHIKEWGRGGLHKRQDLKPPFAPVGWALTALGCATAPALSGIHSARFVSQNMTLQTTAFVLADIAHESSTFLTYLLPSFSLLGPMALEKKNLPQADSNTLLLTNQKPFEVDGWWQSCIYQVCSSPTGFLVTSSS